MKLGDKTRSDVLIEATNLSKRYQLYERPRDRLLQLFARGEKKYFREFWALKEVSFAIHRGEAVGIIGRNGAGKSTLLQLVTGTLSATTGNVKLNGRIGALLQLGSGFNPDFTGRENVYLNGAILGFHRREISAKFDEIAEFADIGDFMEQPVKSYSSGMTMRLAFAVSACLNPEVLIVDEALAVGDALFQRKCYARLDRFVEAGGALLFVSHSLETIKRVCDRAIYLAEGHVRSYGRPSDVTALYEFDLDASNKAEAKSQRLAAVPDYTSHGAEIVAYWIEAEDGRKSSIRHGSRFRWCYQVQFKQDLENVNFGMKVVNTEGLIMFATNAEQAKMGLSSFRAGTTKIFSFELHTDSISPGEYFLSAGVSKISDGSEFFLHRKVDAFHLSIERSLEETYSGMVNMKASIEVR